MIAHISIPARDPRRAAELFGRLIDGAVMPFPVVPGAWVAMARDGSGLGIEVMPWTSAFHPGEGQPDGRVADGPVTMPWETDVRQDGDAAPAGFHAAITTNLSVEEVTALADEMGWRAVPCERGGVFDLVELWVDNRFLVELLPPGGTRRYLGFYTPDVASRMFGEVVAA